MNNRNSFNPTDSIRLTETGKAVAKKNAEQKNDNRVNSKTHETTKAAEAIERTDTAMVKIVKKRRVPSDRILAKDIRVSNDTHVTRLNNNDLIIGPSGGGKTRGYVIPNILNAKDSLIVADTKGNLCKFYGGHLRKQGYKVMHINFCDIAKTEWGYNPLTYIRKNDDPEHIRRGDRYNEQDIKKIAHAICPVQDKSDPFWDQAAQMYLECFILYIVNHMKPDTRNLYTAYELLTKLDSYRDIFDDVSATYPNSAFAMKYLSVKKNETAEKMDASIRGILARHLDVVSYSSTERMFKMEQQMKLEDFLRGKVALFLSISDSDRTQDALVNLFYTQALQYLLTEADKRPDSRLPIPVRFILDDFSTNTVIPDFDNIISVIRSREISVSLIVQSLSQLEGLYEHAKSQTIINNCDHCLYLGGVDTQTAEYFAKKFNRPVSEVLNLPLDKMFLFTRGAEPMEVRQYDLNEDAVYCRLNSRQSSVAKRGRSEGKPNQTVKQCRKISGGKTGR